MSDETRPEQNEVHDEPSVPVFKNDDDPTILKVRGKEGENKQYIKQLAHAIITVLSKYGYANLRCVGASAVNNAVKSFTVASGEAKIKGLNLVLSGGFNSANFDGIEKTALMLKVFDR